MPRLLRLAALAGALLVLCCALLARAQAVVDPAFTLVRVWENLVNPTAVRFAKNGRVFVIGKGGVIYTASSLNERNLKVAADLSPIVFNNFDKGLVGLQPHPNFPATPTVYVLYARDGEIGGPSPVYNDLCPSGVCFTSGALARLTWNADLEKLENLQEIIVDWCSGSTTHAMGDLRFDANNNLLLSSGDNTFFSNTLNFGEAPNRCPLGESNGADTSGVMLAQSNKSTSGKVMYVPLAALDAWQPGQAAPVLREVARGFRNPYRFAIDPNTNQAYVGDVGFGEWEELSQLPAAGSPPKNYGWPCYEGSMVTPTVQERGFARCSDMYAGRIPHERAVYQYSHFGQIGTSVTRAEGQSAITAVGVYRNATSAFPAAWRNAVFFADYTRGSFWGFQANGANTFDWTTPRQMVTGLEQLVDITPGPDGALYLSQIWAGVVWRFNAASAEKPVVRVTASPQGGQLPLAVSFSSTGTFDPLGGALTYAWDLDGTGAFAGPNTATAQRTFTVAGPVTVSLRVRTAAGATNTGSVQVYPGSTFEIGTGTNPITFNVADGTVRVGQPLRVTAPLTANGQPVPAANYEWELLMSHCYPPPPCRPDQEECHQHLVNRYSGVNAIDMVFPDHEAPSWLTFNLKVTHPTSGYTVTYTRRLTPAVIQAQIATDPPGLEVILNLNPKRMPAVAGGFYQQPTLSNGELSLDVQSLQMLNRQGYQFASWSQGGAGRQVITPVAGVTYTARFTPITIGSYPTGQGPSMPTALAVAPGFQQCVATWSAPATTPAAITSYIVYHREVKFGVPIPAWSTGLVPVSTTTYTITVDVGSQCDFQIAAVTSVGESSFKTPISSVFSSPIPSPGSNACVDTSCKYRSLLIDDFNHETSPRNMLGQLQESEVGMMVPFDVINNKLNFRPQRGAASYWYSLLAGTAQCLDTTPYSHLTFKMTAAAGELISVGMDTKDANCAAFIPKKTVLVSQYTPEGRFTGAEQTVDIPLDLLTDNRRGVQSVFFNGFSATPGLFIMDDFALVNRCTNPPTTTGTATSTPTPTGTPGGCTDLVVNSFTNPDQNALGLWAGQELLTATYAGGVMTASATTADAYWATLLAGATCRDLTAYGSVQFNIAPVAAGVTTYPSLQLQARNLACTARDPEVSATVPIAPHVTNGVATIPLSAFTGFPVVRAHALVLNAWPLNTQYRISNLRFVCAAPTTTSTMPATTTTPAPTTTPGTCAPRVIDTFAAADDANSLGYWAGGEAGTFTKANGALTIRSTGAGTYFATILAPPATCNSIAGFAALQFGLTVPAGATLPVVQLQQRVAGCAARNPEANINVALTPAMIVNGVASVPLSAFAGADLALAHAFVLSGFTLNADYVLRDMRLTCGAATTLPPTSTTTPPTATTTTTSAGPTTTSTPPGTCAALTVDTFAAAGEANSLGFWAGGEGATFAKANNALTVTPNVAAGTYFASVLSGANVCRDLTQYQSLRFGVTGTAPTTVVLQLRAAGCAARDPAANFRVSLAQYIAAGVATVPLSAFAGADLTRAHGIVLEDWTQGAAATLTNMQFVCAPAGTTAPPATTTTTVPSVTMTTTTSTAPAPSCTRTSVDFATPAAGSTLADTVNLLGQWAGGDPVGSLASVAGPPRALRVTAAATNTIWWASVLAPAGGCYNVTPYSSIELYVTGPANGSFRVELQSTAATVTNCAAAAGTAIQRRYATVNTTGATRQRVLVPLAPYMTAGMVATKLKAYSFGQFTAGTFTIDSVSLVTASC